MRGQRAQVLVFFALALPLVLLPVAAYAVDAAVAATGYSRLVEVTSRAAQEAAQQIDVGHLRATGALIVDTRAATSSARAILAEAEPAAQLIRITVSLRDIKLVTSETIVLPFNFMRDAQAQLQASATARIADGYDRPSSLLPLPLSTF
jgi:hypothetical protein